jgi:hypothetical protein
LYPVFREDPVPRFFTVLAGIIALAASGCGAVWSPDPSCPPSSNDPFCASLPPGATAVTSVRISARKGGTIALSDGSSIALSAGSLAHSTIVRAALQPQPNEAPPSRNFRPVGPMLQVALSSRAAENDGTSRAPADTSALYVTLRFHEPPAALRSKNVPKGDISATSVARFMMPIARIYDTKETTHYIDLPMPFELDRATGDAIVSIKGYPAYLVPGSRIEMFFVTS